MELEQLELLESVDSISLRSTDVSAVRLCAAMFVALVKEWTQ